MFAIFYPFSIFLEFDFAIWFEIGPVSEIDSTMSGIGNEKIGIDPSNPSYVKNYGIEIESKIGFEIDFQTLALAQVTGDARFSNDLREKPCKVLPCGFRPPVNHLR